MKASELPAIRAFRMNGKLYSLDNRRLKAFQDAGLKIKTVKATKAELTEEFTRKFTTVNDGASVRVRGRYKK